MAFGELKQKSVLLDVNRQKKLASDLISSYHLFKEENDLIIQGSIITSASSEGEFARCREITSFYNNNSSCFVFKLIDDSIITLFILLSNEGIIEKFSYGFCSCPIMKDILIEEYDNLPIREYDINSDIKDQKDYLFTQELKLYFTNKCQNDSKLLDSLIDIAKNPIYIRCDYDSVMSSEHHPEYHLTVNFIKESRFKIDSGLTFYDFVVFILDVVYGKKEEHPHQFIHLTV